MNLTIQQLMEMMKRNPSLMPVANPTEVTPQPMTGLLAETITLPPVEVMPDNMDVERSPELLKYLEDSTREQQERIYEQERMKNQTPIIDPILNLIDKLMLGGK